MSLRRISLNELTWGGCLFSLHVDDSVQTATIIWDVGDNIFYGWTKAIWTISLLQQPYENIEPTPSFSIHFCVLFLLKIVLISESPMGTAGNLIAKV